ncbi:hypothetical protein [Sinorhizobium saheli]|uniref:hypothetical protein n=1 Tax=Sinorhizobium saheli TaxID=36856 RepID=UPI0014288D64|nr:hypothetical protein [Sinorhizobium saheli]
MTSANNAELQRLGAARLKDAIPLPSSCDARPEPPPSPILIRGGCISLATRPDVTEKFRLILGKPCQLP